MKRNRHLSSSDSSDNESPSTSWSSHSKYRVDRHASASGKKKSAEVFRKDLISAMKIPDSHHVNQDECYLLADQWKQEWEKGVQVPASPETIPNPSVRVIVEKVKETLFTKPRKYIRCSTTESTDPGYINMLELADSVCRYDLDDMDIYWLQAANEELREMGCSFIPENTMERTIEALERHCYENMNHAIETEEGLGIEYDEDVICDVCRSPDSEEGNEMVFCDRCNICVHQACYGILKVPEGSWLCRTCVLGLYPQCLLCPKQGGAMKATRAGTKWAHVSCALWIPEVSIACPERMEPITKVSHIPPSRWSLVCSLCKLKTGACIQCSVKSCITAFHVTCAFEHSLEMKTILDDGDEVKFKSYCLKHSKNRQSQEGDCEQTVKISEQKQKQTETEKKGLRAQKLQELEEEFYTLVRVADVACELNFPEQVVEYIFEYWKLKRKSNFSKPLLPPKEDEEHCLGQQKEDRIHSRMKMFMHLRQDLERVRNLCYMVSRREKLKLSQSKVQEQLFNLHIQVMNQHTASGLPLPFPREGLMFHDPPRIMIKLKTSAKPSQSVNSCSTTAVNGPVSLNVERSLYSKDNPPTPQGSRTSEKLQSHHWLRHEERSNGLLLTGSHHRQDLQADSSLPSPECHVEQATGKPSALHIPFRGQSANANGKTRDSNNPVFLKSNGLSSRSGIVIQRDCSSQTYDKVTTLTNHFANQGTFRKSKLGEFGQSCKDRLDSLVRTSEDFRNSEKPLRRPSAKDRLWSKQLSEHQTTAAYQDNDGYCPDVELSDSETETDIRQERNRLRKRNSDEEIPSQDYGRDSRSEQHGKESRSRLNVLCHISSVQR
ncbi:protein Jade-3 isoform X1 [Amblyraja radiata]|uniref:protein Jade-3 isoform X1 n=2 Tax=Amblyraja radiata TaxID=386614 RepID=UPI001402D51D|nr:protein Jade-3 isoform X1 [Amblyraja radiata]